MRLGGGSGESFGSGALLFAAKSFLHRFRPDSSHLSSRKRAARADHSTFQRTGKECHPAGPGGWRPRGRACGIRPALGLPSVPHARGRGAHPAPPTANAPGRRPAAIPSRTERYRDAGGFEHRSPRRRSFLRSPPRRPSARPNGRRARVRPAPARGRREGSPRPAAGGPDRARRGHGRGRNIRRRARRCRGRRRRGGRHDGGRRPGQSRAARHGRGGLVPGGVGTAAAFATSVPPASIGIRLCLR